MQKANGNLSDRLLQWLQAFGFTADPFGEWEASQENLLERYFVPLPVFEKLVDESKSITTLLFAGRGCGKSAHRIMLQTRCRPFSPTSTVLAVPYTDFTPFLTDSDTTPVAPALSKQLEIILYNGIQVLVEELTQRPLPWFNLTSEEKLQLQSLARIFAPDVLRPTQLARRLGALLDGVMTAKELQNAIREGTLALQPAEHKATDEVAVAFWLELSDARTRTVNFPNTLTAFREFVELACALELNSVCVLVDGLDEMQPFAEPQNAASFLAPLLTNLPLMEMTHCAFKFFLPSSVGSALKGNELVRFDRLRTVELEWDVPGLKRLLAVRLRSFHPEGRIDGLGAMAEEDLRERIDDELARHAFRSPRALVILGHLLFTSHCEVNSEKSLLTRKDLERALDRFRREYRQAIVAAPLLRIDKDKRRVLIGDQDRNQKWTLREFELLKFLYSAQGSTRSENEIRRAVFGAETDEQRAGVSDEAIDSLVHRLRKKIERDPKNPIYLLTDRGHGYRLVNTE